MQQIEWTPDNFRYVLIMLGVIEFFACIGAVTSLRWAVRQELRMRKRSKTRRSMQRWASAPKPRTLKPRTPKTSTGGAAAPSAPSHPMRLNDGPRDWKQRLTD